MTEQNQNFTMWQGETKTLEVTLSDDPDIAGQAIQWVLATEEGGEVKVSKDTADGIEITGDAAHHFEISLDPEDTQGIAGRHYHEARIDDEGGTENVLFTGEATIHESATASQ